MRDNPNSHLFQMHNEVGLLQRKIEPLLQRVERSANTVKNASFGQGLGSTPGPLGMLSKMGGRFISFYAEDLSDMLFEDFLTETVKELQRIEKIAQKEYKDNEVKQMADDMLLMVADFQADEHLVDTRWNNKQVQREIKEMKLGELNKGPQPIELDLHGNLEDINESRGVD